MCVGGGGVHVWVDVCPLRAGEEGNGRGHTGFRGGILCNKRSSVPSFLNAVGQMSKILKEGVVGSGLHL